MCITAIFVFFELLFAPLRSYNLDALYPVTFEGDSVDETFGYSVALQLGERAGWVLVGAPTANVTLDSGGTGERYGIVYNCSITTSKCTRLNIDTAPEAAKEHKTNQWLGVAMSRNPANEDVVACAHRYAKVGEVTLKDELGIRGKCWNVASDGRIQLLPSACSPPNGENDRCQSGMSVTAAEELVGVGAVGDYQGRGSVYLQTNSINNYMDTGQRMKVWEYYGYAVASYSYNGIIYVFSSAPRGTGANRLGGKVGFIKVNKDKPNVSPEHGLVGLGRDMGSGFGHTLACGLTKAGKIQVLISAPLWYDKSIPNDFDRGAVSVYDMIDRASFERARLLGENSGDRFGHAICNMGDMDGDGYDDIAIGAPYHDSTGAVYIYLGSVKGLTSRTKYVQKIRPLPSATVSNFGSALAGGADVDFNGFSDLAVGAYGAESTFFYRSLPILNIRVNVSSPALLDKNDTCPGADTACFTLTYCIAYLPGGPVPSLLNNTYELNVTNKLDTDYDGSRIRFEDKSLNSSEIIPIKYSQKSAVCKNRTVYLQDILTNIKKLIVIETRVTEVASEEFNSRFVLNSSLDNYNITQVKIKTSCGNATCLTDLILSGDAIKFDKENGIAPRSDVVYAGYNDIIWSNYTIKRNTSLGKPFGSHLIISMPVAMYINSIRDINGTKLSICVPYGTSEGVMFCSLSAELDNNYTDAFSFSVEFSVSSVKLAGQVLVTLEVMSEGSDEQNPDNNKIQHQITVRKLANVNLAGTTSDKSLKFKLQKEKKIIRYAEDIGIKSEVTFLPTNSGPSSLKLSKITFEVPFKFNNMLNQDFLYPYSTDSNIEVKCETQNLNTKHISSKKNSVKATRSVSESTRDGEESPSPEPGLSDDGCDSRFKCVNISCVMTELTTDLVGVRLKSFVWEQSFEKETKISTYIRAWFFNQDPDGDLTKNSYLGPIKVSLVIEAARKTSKKVSFWTLVGSIAGGLTALSLIIVILKQVGFFKRKRPPKSEFFSSTNPNCNNDGGFDNSALDVKDNLSDSAQDADDEEDNQFAFTNPLADNSFGDDHN